MKIIKILIWPIFLGLLINFLYDIPKIIYHPASIPPQLKYIIEYQSPLVHSFNNIRELKIFYGKQDLQKQNLSLVLMKITIKNDLKDIKKIDYANDDPWGIHFLNIKKGRLVGIFPAETYGNEYLSKSLNPNYKDKDKVVFDKVFFDKGDKFSFGFLLLLPNNQVNNPSMINIKPIGKISGINSSDIKIIRNDIYKPPKLVFDSPVYKFIKFILFTLLFPALLILLTSHLILIFIYPKFKKNNLKRKMLILLKDFDQEKVISVIQLYLNCSKYEWGIVSPNYIFNSEDNIIKEFFEKGYARIENDIYYIFDQEVKRIIITINEAFNNNYFKETFCLDFYEKITGLDLYY